MPADAEELLDLIKKEPADVQKILRKAIEGDNTQLHVAVRRYLKMGDVIALEAIKDFFRLVGQTD